MADPKHPNPSSNPMPSGPNPGPVSPRPGPLETPTQGEYVKKGGTPPSEKR